MVRYKAPSIDDRRIWDLWLTGTYQAAIVAADDSGIFAALHTAPATASELASRLNFDERATEILLRLLSALGLLASNSGRFRLSREADRS